MAVAEYQPIQDIVESRKKLAELAEQIEITSQQLFEASLDVIATRGGERWRDLKEVSLHTAVHKSRTYVLMSYQSQTEQSAESVRILIAGSGRNNVHIYEVRNVNGADYDIGEMLDYGRDLRGGRFTPLTNFGGLAPARILSYVEKGNRSTPFPGPKRVA